jgi:uncharacterized protein
VRTIGCGQPAAKPGHIERIDSKRIECERGDEGAAMKKADLRLTVLVAVVAGAAFAGPAHAQLASGRSAFGARSDLVQPVQFGDFFRPFWGGGGWGGNWGGGGGYYPPRRSYDPYNPFGQRQQQTYEPLKPPAPAARKPDAPAPTETVLVIGDQLADWLAFGLEAAFADTPQVGIVRKMIRPYSGLVRYEPRADTPDWSQVVKETLAGEKPAAIVIMLGLNDRLPLRDKAPAPESAAANAGGETVRKPAAAAAPPATYEFRTDQWGDAYGKRIDEMIAALKSKGAPIVWVGLPSVRGVKPTDMQYLDELYRAHAEKAGIVYVDIWDGFVDERGNFAQQGPDFQGQTRRLRTYDGINFTSVGAEKLAHYVERELRRVLNSHIAPVALPGPEEQSPAKGAGAKPVIGPVVPLGAIGSGEGGELAGAGRAAQKDADPLANRVLNRGEALNAPRGRADDFSWPRADASGERGGDALPADAGPTAPSNLKGVGGKTENNKTETNKIEASKTETDQSEAGKNDASKNDASKSEPKKPAAAAVPPAAPARPRPPPRAELDGAPPRPPLPVGPAAGR